jgi:hypothetical protein
LPTISILSGPTPLTAVNIIFLFIKVSIFANSDEIKADGIAIIKISASTMT